jgi:hypothetical protein
MALTLSDITQLLTVEGENQYGGEAVSLSTRFNVQP